MAVRAWWGAASALACAIAVGCSSFTNDGGQATTGEDAGSEASVAPPAPAPPPPPPPVDGGSTCVPGAHTLCDDFEGHDLPGPWDDFTSALPAKLAIVTSDKSTSHVLSVTQSDLDGGPYGTALLRKSITRSDATRIVCALSMYINALGPQGVGTAGSLLHYGLTTNASSEVGSPVANLGASGSGTSLLAFYYPTDGGAQASWVANAATLPFGKWLRIAYEVDFASRAYTVSFDGANLMNGTVPFSVTKSNGATIELGISISTIVSDYLIDDVVCDVTP